MVSPDNNNSSEDVNGVNNTQETSLPTTDAVTTASVSNAPVTKFFSSKKINVTLDDQNYLLWHQQVYLTIKTNRLLKYVDENAQAPPKYINQNGIVCINPEFEFFEEQDGALASWLLSTVSEPVLHHLVGLSTSSDVWNTLHRLYSIKTTSRLMSFRRMLHSQKKGDLSMQEFLMKIKSICDNLANCGERISDQEHITAILNGLSSEYDYVITVITASPTSSDLAFVSTILLDVDARQANLINHVNASAHVVVQHSPPNSSIDHTHVVQTSGQSVSSPHVSNTRDITTQAYDYNTSQVTQTGHTGYNYNNRGRGRANRNTNRPQCQLCGRLGHLVDMCYYRFDMNFKNNELARSTSANRNTTATQANLSTFTGLPYNTVYCCNPLPPVSSVTGPPQMLQPSQQLMQPQSQVMYTSSSIPQHVLQPQSPIMHASSGSPLNAAATPSISYYPMSSVAQVAQPQFAAAPTQLQPQFHLSTTEVLDDNAWYPDSDATHHLTNDSTNLQAGSVLPGTGNVQVGSLVSVDDFLNFQCSNITDKWSSAQTSPDLNSDKSKVNKQLVSFQSPFVTPAISIHPSSVSPPYSISHAIPTNPSTSSILPSHSISHAISTNPSPSSISPPHYISHAISTNPSPSSISPPHSISHAISTNPSPSSISPPHSISHAISTNPSPSSSSPPHSISHAISTNSSSSSISSPHSTVPSPSSLATVQNNHPMITRGKSGIFKPKVYLLEGETVEPATVFEALQQPKWKDLNSDHRNSTCVWVWVCVNKEHVLSPVVGDEVKVKVDASGSDPKCETTSQGR
ncbi:hypothetical protein GQ457_08G023800 [Hibiscus cannabinus]